MTNVEQLTIFAEHFGNKKGVKKRVPLSFPSLVLIHFGQGGHLEGAREVSP
jgi:hypothetical protein